MHNHDEIILNKDNPAVKYLCTKDKRLSKVIDTIGEISYQPHDLLYRRDYYTVILDANKILHDYIELHQIDLNKLSHCDLKIDYAAFLQLTPEEWERVGNGKGGIIVRNGRSYAILGDTIKLHSVHKLKEWE